MAQIRQNLLPHPQSNLSMIIFPFDRTRKRFDTSVYAPALTQFRISSQDLLTFFERLNEAADYFTGVNWTFVSVILYVLGFVMDGLMMILSVLILVSRYTFDKEMDSIIFTIGALSAMLSFTIWVILVTLCSSRTGRKEKKIRARLNEFIMHQNPVYAQVGLRWKLPTTNNYDWIELWLDYRYVEDANSIIIHNTLQRNPLYQPPKIDIESNVSPKNTINDENVVVGISTLMN